MFRSCWRLVCHHSAQVNSGHFPVLLKGIQIQLLHPVSPCHVNMVILLGLRYSLLMFPLLPFYFSCAIRSLMLHLLHSAFSYSQCILISSAASNHKMSSNDILYGVFIINVPLRSFIQQRLCSAFRRLCCVCSVFSLHSRGATALWPALTPSPVPVSVWLPLQREIRIQKNNTHLWQYNLTYVNVQPMSKENFTYRSNVN